MLYMQVRLIVVLYSYSRYTVYPIAAGCDQLKTFIIMFTYVYVML
jgi:hypothetical protein